MYGCGPEPFQSLTKALASWACELYEAEQAAQRAVGEPQVAMEAACEPTAQQRPKPPLAGLLNWQCVRLITQ